MTRIERSALVNFSCEQMFGLVNDVARYPEFMDGCVAAEILHSSDTELTARLTLSKAGVKQSFVTRNQLSAPHRMTLALVEGPFSKLQGAWQFTPLGELGCKISFELEFEIASRLLGAAAGKVFESVASQQVDALCRRAQQLYPRTAD